MSISRRLLIDKTVVDFAGTDPENHDDLWVDALSPLFAASLLQGPAHRQRRKGQSWLLDQLVFSEGVFTDQLIRRGKHHLNSTANMLWVGVLRHGEILGQLGDDQVHMRPGTIHVLDFSRSYSAKCAPSHVNSVLVAHDMVGYDPSRHAPVFTFTGRTVIGKVLMQTLLGVFAQLDRTTRAEAPAVAHALIALLQAVLFTEPDAEPVSPGFTQARSRSIRAHIDQNLRSDALGPQTICARFNISRATLYRDFRDAGGIERYIQERRLDAALFALAEGPAERGAVSRAAEKWGFTSVTHFSREFRRRFGVSPSEIVGQRQHIDTTARGVDDGARAGTLGRFLDKL